MGACSWRSRRCTMTFIGLQSSTIPNLLPLRRRKIPAPPILSDSEKKKIHDALRMRYLLHTLSVFCLFSYFYLRTPLNLYYLVQHVRYSYGSLNQQCHPHTHPPAL